MEAKKRQHQRCLQSGIKLQLHLQGGAQQQQYQRDHQAAGNRFGDVEGAQQPDPGHQYPTKQQYQRRRDQGCVGIKL